MKTQSLSMGSNTIDVSSFAKGMYSVSIITEQGKETKKIIVE
ncbi:MAG: T9SS type A sorting domain-containing protein [Chitinophagaceae bacterium]